MSRFAHDATVLAEARRRAVLALFVREGWLEAEVASSMLAWPHSGFSAYVSPAIAAEDRAAVLRVARPEGFRAMAAAEFGGGSGGCSGAWAGVAGAPTVWRWVRTGEKVVAGWPGGAYARGVRERRFLSFTLCAA